MVLEFRSFVEVGSVDGYGNVTWTEPPADPTSIPDGYGYLDGYSNNYDGYFTDEFYCALATIKDGYYYNLFKRPLPADLSRTVQYKKQVLSKLGVVTNYYLTLTELNAFDWNRQVYASFFTKECTFANVGAGFMNYYLPALQALAVTTGSADLVRIVVLKFI